MLLGPASSWAGESQADFPLFPYAKQGRFVVVPARVVSTPVVQTGFILGSVLCLPVSIAQEARAKGDVPRDKEASLVCGQKLGLALGWPVYAATGLPFYLVKKLFWDGPRAIAGLFSSPEKTDAADGSVK